MTTIAYREGVLCADTQVTSGTVISGVFEKAVRLPCGGVAAAMGCLEDIFAFQEWLAERGERPTLDEGTFCGIYVAPNGQAFEYYNKLVRTPVFSPYWACGSGNAFALAAMAMGASAEEVACKLDVYSSGPLTVLRIT